MYIYSIGHYFPENILDNAFFDRLDIESSADWIRDRVGIEARRSVLTQEQVMDLRHGRTTREQLKAEGAKFNSFLAMNKHTRLDRPLF